VSKHFKIYQGNDDQTYWRFVADNGRTRADGGEGYIEARDAIGGVRGLINDIKSCDWEVRYGDFEEGVVAIVVPKDTNAS